MLSWLIGQECRFVEHVHAVSIVQPLVFILRNNYRIIVSPFKYEVNFLKNIFLKCTWLG